MKFIYKLRFFFRSAILGKKKVVLNQDEEYDTWLGI